MELYYVVIFATLINAFGGIVYMKDTLEGKTKPNKVTWGIWTVAPLIGSAAMCYSQGLSWNILPVFMAGFVPLLVFIASFVNPKSYWKLNKLDYICLASAILALVLWGITKNPLLAIIFGILTDFFAAIPIIIKSYKFPETETVFAFYTGFLSALSSFLVIKNWTIEEYLFPTYLVIICLVLILAYYGKKILKLFSKIT